jgi:uncharacterized NAD(P)/FAD-binding protein YdhS
MKKKLFACALALVCGLFVFAQEKKLYDPLANAEKDIQKAVKKAAAENKMVLIINSAIVVRCHNQNSSVSFQELHHFISVLKIDFEVGCAVPYQLLPLSQKG